MMQMMGVVMEMVQMVLMRAADGTVMEQVMVRCGMQRMQVMAGRWCRMLIVSRSVSAGDGVWRNCTATTTSRKI